MSKSFCIKTNDTKILSYLLNELDTLNLSNSCISENNFKIYKNIILHYTGEDSENFTKEISLLLSKTIINYYEKLFVRRIINTNYFYFDNFEKSQIISTALDVLQEEEYEDKYDVVFENIYKFLSTNKSIVLDGFVNFRLKNYIGILDSAIDFSVNKFLIEQEYDEFIKLLKAYIDSKPATIDTVHLIYTNQTCILLDEEKNIISLSKDLLNAKYLSDISFSSNDYALNTLLNILPRKLYIHLIDLEDDFIKTLKLIFGSRVLTCTDCNLCKTYQLTKTVMHAKKD